MDERRKRLLGDADDADARGEHQYPNEPQANDSEVAEQNGEAAEDALSREPDAYVAGADGTQPVTTPDSKPS